MSKRKKTATNLYKTLDIPKDATPAEIRRAHRRKTIETHPDVTKGANEPFLAVQLAYEVLRDGERRRRYDETGEVDDGPVDKANKALEEAVKLVVKLAAAGEPGRFDLIDRAKQQVTAETAAAKSHIDQLKERAKRFDAFAERITVKGGENLLARAMKEQADGLREAVVHTERRIAELAAVMELLAGYGFRVDMPLHAFRTKEPTSIEDLMQMLIQ